MIVEYRTDRLVIAGDKRRYTVFDTLHNPNDGSILVTDPLFSGSMPQCKAYVDGFLEACRRHEAGHDL